MKVFLKEFQATSFYSKACALINLQQQMPPLSSPLKKRSFAAISAVRLGTDDHASSGAFTRLPSLTTPDQGVRICHRMIYMELAALLITPAAAAGLV